MMCYFRALAFLIVASHACHDYWCDSEGKLHFYTGCPYECDHDRCAGQVEGSGIIANAQTGGCHSDTHAGCELGHREALVHGGRQLDGFVGGHPHAAGLLDGRAE